MTTDWQEQSEKKNLFWLEALLWVLRIAGRTLTRWLLLPIVCAYFLLFDGQARQASKLYLAKVLSAPPRLWHVLRHLHTFASVSLDRILVMDQGPAKLDVDIVNDACFEDLPEGAVLITSHYGSFDVMRVLAESRNAKEVRVLLNIEHNKRAMALVNRLNPELASLIIDAGVSGPSLILQVQKLLASSALVGVMADRLIHGQRFVQLPFCGAAATFPLAPWLMAAMLDQPIILCFGTFLGSNKYRLEFERVVLPKGNSRQKAEAGLRFYVQQLEQRVRRAPYNWFNFYDFWQQNMLSEPKPWERGL